MFRNAESTSSSIDWESEQHAAQKVQYLFKIHSKALSKENKFISSVLW